MAIDSTVPRTRRAILMGVVGAVAASVAATVGRASPVGATNNEYVRVGHTYTATIATEIDATGADGILASSDSGIGVTGTSQDGAGLYGSSNTGNGVYGSSMDENAIFGTSHSSSGVYGESDLGIGVYGFGGQGKPGALGRSTRSSTGVQGYSNDANGPLPAAVARTGVYGRADQDQGIGIYGVGASGRGGVFKGGNAQVRLMPSSAASHPVNGAMGDLFVDSAGRLWYCKTTGNPAVWKQVSLV